MRLLGHHVHPAYLLLGAAEFACAVVAFLGSGWAIRSLTSWQTAPAGWSSLVWAGGFGFAVLLGMLAMGLYHPRQRLTIEGIVARQIIGLTIAAILLALADQLLALLIPGIHWLSSSFLCLVLLVVVRLGFERVVDQKAFRRRVLVLGAGESASNLLQLRRKSDQRGFKLVAFLPSKSDKYTLDDPRVEAYEGPLLDFVISKNVSEIVVAMDERRQALPILDLLNCRFAGVDVVSLVQFLERETGRVKVDIVTPDWMIYSAGYTANAFRDFVLRAFDLIVLAATAVLALPLMMAIGVFVMLADGRPILYRQVRVGLRGKEFTLYKFRSMIKDAEVEGGAQWAASGDVRITGIGSVLRKYRLDELPQLLNVLRGEMSLVGPRPERPAFVEQLAREIPYYNERHCVKPGITGWAQMSYPYGSSEEDAKAKLAFDLYYVKHRSLIFNISVLLQTAEVVLWSKGSR
jgi:sugar transferase (PEP-CTERM system associated)